MKYAFFMIILLTGAMIALAAPGITPDPENLPNLQEPRAKVFTAAQPTEVGIRETGSLGVRTVINVLPESQCWTDEAELVREQGMAYISLPFHTEKFKMATIQKFAQTLENQPGPVLIHCSTGNHVGGLWFAYRVLIEKATLSSALREARQIGLKPELESKLILWATRERSKLRTAETGS